MKNLKTLIVALITLITISSCSKDDPKKEEPVNEEEVITTVTIVYVPVDGGNSVTLKSRDLDGAGSNQPEVTVSGPFAINKTYNGEITVLNESVSPVENVSEAILTEAVDHQFFYQKTGTLPLFLYSPIAEAPNNYDLNGKPLGIKTKLVTTNPATGNLIVTLKHEGNKSAPNVANGDITNATGATDFEVKFLNIIVQ
jgi:hypothetical protein